MDKLMPWSALYEMKADLMSFKQCTIGSKDVIMKHNLLEQNVLHNYASVTSGYCIVCCMDKDASRYLDPFSELANSYSNQGFFL